MTIAGRTYRVRLQPSGSQHNFDLEMRADGRTVFTPGSVFNTEGRWGIDASDRQVAYYLGGARLIDLVTVGGRLVGDELIGHVVVPTPDGTDVTGEPYIDLVVTVFHTATPHTMGAGGPHGWVVRFEDGGVWDLDQH